MAKTHGLPLKFSLKGQTAALKNELTETYFQSRVSCANRTATKNGELIEDSL
jgi:hypothetical protein